MTGKQRKTLIRIVISAALLVTVWLLPLQGIFRLLVFLIPYLVIGWDVLFRAARNIVHGQVFDENFLMSLATIGAFAIGEYPEAVAVMLFYQIGEFFQSYAVGRSRQSIADLMNIRPDDAYIEQDGAIVRVDPEQIAVGDVIVIRAGEKIPMDGIVLEGDSLLDTAALTGESMPRQVSAGDDVISGCINQTGFLRVRVTKAFEESTVFKILDLVENSSSRKARAENFITRFARYYTPVVVISALLLAVLPPLFLKGSVTVWGEWLHRALIFLVVSCPCALVISVPMSFFGGIGKASRCGILVKGGNDLEALAHAETVVFDKTGTLTKGVFEVTAVHPVGCSEQELLETAALAESYSNHPIAQSLRRAYGKEPDLGRVGKSEELSGRGICTLVDGKKVFAGNGKLMQEIGTEFPFDLSGGTVVHIALENAYIGSVVISDEPKPDAAQTVRLLKECGIRKTVMLTGDGEKAARSAAEGIGIDEVHAKLLPADKVERVEELLKQKSSKGTLAFVGDGINDAPVLSRADIGIAMGAMGSDAAIEAADIVLMDDKPSKIAEAIKTAKKTLKIVRENIVLALAVKILVLILGALGLANMWEAVFADVGVSILAVLNAMRTLKK